MKRFELAACVIIPTGGDEREILAISRRNDPTKWGIPGGKQDPGESNVQCACREILEELGIELEPNDLIPLYSGACYGADGRDFWVTTYLLKENLTGMLESPEEGFLIKPMKMLSLCNEAVSPFAGYNQHVITAWRDLE